MNRTTFLLALASAILLSLAYPPAFSRWLVFIALIPLFYFLNNASKKNAFWGTLLFAFIFIGWNIRWVFATLPAVWAGISNPIIGFTTVSFVWLITAFTLALPMGIFGFVYKKILRQTIKSAKIKKAFINWSLLVIPSLWILAEYLRALLFSIVWIGPDSLIGPNWTYGFLGYTLIDVPILLQSSKLFGVYGAGFLIVFINVLLLYFITDLLRHISARTNHVHNNKKEKPKKEISFTSLLISAIFILGIVVYGIFQLTNIKSTQSTKKIALVQTDESYYGINTSKELNQYIDLELKLLRSVAHKKPDIVILPEDSRLTFRFRENTREVFADIFGGEQRVLIVDSTRLDQYQSSPERIYFYDTHDGITAISDKILTIPGGEYLPYVVKFPAKIFGWNTWLTKYEESRNIKRGLRVPIPALSPHTQLEGVQLCSAVHAPGLWRELVKEEGAQVLINAASQGLFKKSSFHKNAEASLRFYAASNDRWLAQAANGGLSYIIDNFGIIRKTTKNFGNAVLISEIEYRNTIAPYTRFGDWPLGAAVAIILLYTTKNMMTQKWQYGHTNNYSSGE